MADLVMTLRSVMSKSGVEQDTGNLREEITLSSAVKFSDTPTIGTSEADLSLGSVTAPCTIILQQVTAGTTVGYGPKTGGGSLEPFAELSDECPFAVIGLKSGETLRWISDTASTQVEVWAIKH